jgi:hypothetical protein
VSDAGESDAGEIVADAVTSLVVLSPDAGVPAWELELPFGEVRALAHESTGALVWLDGAGELHRGEWASDGGWSFKPLSARDAGGGTALALMENRALIDGRWLIELDGGTLVGALPALPDSGVALEADVLLNARAGGAVFFSSCEDARLDSCDAGERITWMRTFDVRDGGLLADLPLFPSGTTVKLAAMVAVTMDGGGGIALFTEAQRDAGMELYLQGFFDGTERVHCPIAGGGRVSAATFDETFLYAVIERDGGWALEGFDLTGAPLDYSGWAGRHSKAGSRRVEP